MRTVFLRRPLLLVGIITHTFGLASEKLRIY